MLPWITFTNGEQRVHSMQKLSIQKCRRFTFVWIHTSKWNCITPTNIAHTTENNVSWNYISQFSHKNDTTFIKLYNIFDIIIVNFCTHFSWRFHHKLIMSIVKENGVEELQVMDLSTKKEGLLNNVTYWNLLKK